MTNAAQSVITDYFESTRMAGTTCDFGGIAMLTESNRTITDDDNVQFDDDSYYTIINEGPAVSTVTVIDSLNVLAFLFHSCSNKHTLSICADMDTGGGRSGNCQYGGVVWLYNCHAIQSTVQ